jgi:hypothetical protein
VIAVQISLKDVRTKAAIVCFRMYVYWRHDCLLWPSSD